MYRGRAGFFHLTVENLNCFRTAVNCYAYLVRAEILPERREIALQEVEFKWRGVMFPNVIIPPSRTREFDGLLVFHDRPHEAITGALTDSPKHRHILVQGKYVLTFAVRSENFPETKKQFYLKLGQHLRDLVFEEMSSADVPHQ